MLQYAPGPINLPDIVKQSLITDIPYFGSEKFSRIIQGARGGLQEALYTKNPILFSNGSGTLLMESCVSNFFNKHSKVVFINCGRYGQNWIKCADIYGLFVKEIKAELTPIEGKVVPLEAIEKWLKNHPDTEGVFCQHVESTTGIKNDIKEISKLVKKYTNAIFIVDAISSFFAEELRVDDWGLDVVISASQKGLSLPPGLGILVCNQKALDAAEKSKLPKFYFDIKEECRRQVELNQTRFTPATNTLYALYKVLEYLKPVTYNIREAIKRSNFYAASVQQFYSKVEITNYSNTPNNAVQVGVLTKGTSTYLLFRVLEEKYGVSLGRGQDLIRDTGIRIKTFGFDASLVELKAVLSAVEMSLKDIQLPGTLTFERI